MPVAAALPYITAAVGVAGALKKTPKTVNTTSTTNSTQQFLPSPESRAAYDNYRTSPDELLAQQGYRDQYALHRGPGGNPYLQDIINQSQRDITDAYGRAHGSLLSTLNFDGAFGGSAGQMLQKQADLALGQSLADSSTNLRYNDYNNWQAANDRALQGLDRSGQYQDEYDSRRLNLLYTGAGQTGRSTTTGTQPNPNYLSPLQRAAGLLSIGGSLLPPRTPNNFGIPLPGSGTLPAFAPTNFGVPAPGSGLLSGFSYPQLANPLGYNPSYYPSNARLFPA